MSWEGKEVQVYPALPRRYPLKGRSQMVCGSRVVMRLPTTVTAARRMLVENAEKTVNWYDHLHVSAMSPGAVPVTLQEAGQAIRRWREGKALTLEDVRDRTGVGVNILSYVERAARKPQKKTITALETGFGWPDGFFLRLAAETGGPDVLDEMLRKASSERQPNTVAPAITVQAAGGDIAVLEDYATDRREMLDALIAALPPESSPQFPASLRAALIQCAKAETLVVSSWRSVSLVDREAAHRFLDMLISLESTRRGLLARVPASTAARLDTACRATELPDTVICGLLGLTGDQLWQARTDGVIPDGSNARVAAFMKAVQTDGP